MDRSDDLDLLAAVSMMPAPDGLVVLALLSGDRPPVTGGSGDMRVLRPLALAGALTVAVGLLTLIPTMA